MRLTNEDLSATTSYPPLTVIGAITRSAKVSLLRKGILFRIAEGFVESKENLKETCFFRSETTLTLEHGAVALRAYLGKRLSLERTCAKKRAA